MPTNPYERMFQSVQRPPPSTAPNGSSSSAPTSASASASASATASDGRPSTHSGSKRGLPSTKKVKPAVSFQCRPRFRFDLPDPPMDPKMLLGRLSTSSYAEPLVSDLERDFRPIAIPNDPSHALRADLLFGASRPRLQTDRKDAPPDLTIDDDALLQSVSSSRSLPSSKTSLDGRRQIPPASTRINETTAPWMRRMGYDEYMSHGTGATRAIPAATRILAPPKREPADSTLARDNRRRELNKTFAAASRHPRHPDPRKSHLKPVRISPILPDFELLGVNLIALEFERDEALTTEDRTKQDSKLVTESVSSMATISLADSSQRKAREAPKKFLACYTPTDSTLGKRKRASEDDGDDEQKEGNDLKKIHYIDDEQYEWFGEFSIREGKFGNSGKPGGMERSCFAVSEFVNSQKSSVACLSRIGTNWMLSRRPFTEGTQRLGKEGLRIARDIGKKKVSLSEKRALISGDK